MADLSPIGQLDGKVSSENKLTATISAIGTINASMSSDIEEKIYDGPYEVIPHAQYDQTLNTADKLLKKDVTVFKVPYTETHNDFGMTAYIATEV